jgi:hypothetical protein
MSLILDGTRSKKRLKVGKNMLAEIKRAGIIPADVTVRDGFRIKVVAACNKIMITAPMGLVVIKATMTKIYMASAEYWLGAINPLREFYVNSTVTTSTAINTTISTPDAESAVYPALPNAFSAYGAVSPSVMPFFDSEGIVYRTSFNMAGSLVSQDEHALSSFESDGSNVRRTSFVNYVYDQYGWHRFMSQCLRKNRYLKSYTGRARYQTGSTQRYLFSIIGIEAGSISGGPVYSGQVWNGNMPSVIYNAIHQDVTGVFILGTYAYTRIPSGELHIVQVIDCSQAINTDIARLKSLSQFSAAEAIEAEFEWSMFYLIFNGDTGNTLLVKSTVFKELMVSKSTESLGEGLLFDYLQASKLVRQFLPYPNISTDYSTEYQQPHDGIMFHCPSGVYSWTRKYGALHFDTDTIKQATLSLPSAVGTTGVRPIITYAGTDDSGDYFLCVCDDVGNKVVSIHGGSPFSGWVVSLPIPDDKLIYVRPIYARHGRIVLLGVAELYDEVDAVTKYHACIIDRRTEADVWKILSEIKGTIEPGNWDITLYGNGGYVNMLNNYPSPPPTTGNPVFKTYSEYVQP